jgi:Domain of unknown function (DUF5666)
MTTTGSPLRTTILSSALCALIILSGCADQSDARLGSPAAPQSSEATNAQQANSLSNVTTKPNSAIDNFANTLVTKEASIGAVTGFGSVIIEGVKYEDDAAVVKQDIDPTQATLGSLKDIKLGMRLAVQADGKKAQSFTLGTEVIGNVSSVGADSFVIAGQTVKASNDPASSTVFEGVAGLSGLALGDFVEIYGQRDANAVIIASRVERKSLGDKALTRVKGGLANLNKAAKTFAIAGLTVSYANALRVVPNPEALIDGANVVVFSDVAMQAGVLNAKAVKVLAPLSELNGLLRIGGLIRGLDFAAHTFMLDGIKVDASKAIFLNGSSSDLANALKVRVVGSFADGKVVATEVSFQKDLGDAQVDVKGEVTDFVKASSFKVRGVPFDASATTVNFVNGDVSRLLAGVKVRIRGEVQGDIVKALAVEFLGADAPVATQNPSRGLASKDQVATSVTSFSIQGSLSNIDVAKKTIRVNGNTFNLPVELADFAMLESLKNGSSISLEGSVDNGQVLANKIVVTKQ